jgi:hypothetical protein
LGSVKPDSEASTLASDDTTGVDDEEGVTIPALKAGRPITITAKATGSNGYLQAWIDWNRDGDFVDINERIATNVQDNSPQDSNNAVGTIGLTLTPSTLISGTSYARFRWSDQNGLNHMALAGEGEVEDYAVTLSNNAIPVITSNGGGMSASMSLPEKQTTVTTVTATDADSDTLTYSIAGGTDSTKFAINASTGVLSFINVPSFVSPQDSDGNNVYDLKVSVSDGFGGVDTQDIAVSITQVIDYVKLSVRVLLQGTEFATGLMTDTLRARKLIPTAQPYTKAPFNYMGTETVSTARLAETGNSAMVDWVLVELRDATDPKIIISQQAAVLERDGDISVPNTGATTLLFSGVYPNTYYVAVRHRNHIAVMTQSALALTNTTRAVDFTLFSTITYGFDGRYILNSTAFMWAGEANQDQFIIANGPDNDTSSVLSLVLMNPDNKLYNSNYILTGYKNADINMDGDVVFAGPENDLNIITANVLLFPSNKTFSGNYVVKGNLP